MYNYICSVLGLRRRKAVYTVIESAKETPDGPYYEKHSVSAGLYRLNRCLLTVFAVILASAVFFGLGWIARHHSLRQQFPKVLLAPEFPLITKVFLSNGPIKNITEQIDKSWQSDMPSGRGFVYVSQEQNDDGSNVFGVAVFHQLHCLYMMQKSFMKAMKDPSQVPETEVWHMYHCAELIRQALKCAADPALDPTVFIPDFATKRGASGWNGTHVCRNFDRLFEWTEANRANNRVGAGILDVDVDIMI